MCIDATITFVQFMLIILNSQKIRTDYETA